MSLRKIKFRAWDKVDEKMRDVLKIDFDIKIAWLLKILSNDKKWAYAIKFDEIELLQYTGLKDRNGKEIYEGDIVKDDKGIFYVVKYEKYHIYPFGKIVNEHDCEVVGNIFENSNCPEYLETEGWGNEVGPDTVKVVTQQRKEKEGKNVL